MSTRSKIGIIREDNTIEAIYCHWDGYPSHHIPILLELYNTSEEVEKLISLGDRSSLDSIGDTYANKNGEEVITTKYPNYQTFVNMLQHSWVEYIYLFYNNEWIYINRYDVDIEKNIKKIYLGLEYYNKATNFTIIDEEDQ